MGMSTVHGPWTVARLNDTPDDGQRYEIIDGELFVTPAPNYRHQVAVRELVLLLAAHAKACGVTLLFAPFDVPFSTHNSVQPDVLVLPALPDDTRPAEFIDVGRLMLAIEVLSPSTARNDRGVKRVLYQRERVDEYWIVDLDARSIERWRPESTEPEVYLDTMMWAPTAERDALVINVAAFFISVIDG
jgi:Uma2 family endonuclease